VLLGSQTASLCLALWPKEIQNVRWRELGVGGSADLPCRASARIPGRRDASNQVRRLNVALLADVVSQLLSSYSSILMSMADSHIPASIVEGKARKSMGNMMFRNPSLSASPVCRAGSFYFENSIALHLLSLIQYLELWDVLGRDRRVPISHSHGP
jgi:hypothetical protein